MSDPNSPGTEMMRAGATAGRFASSEFPTLPRTQNRHHLVICNQKGGCGKSTLAINLAAGMALGGMEVLLIDLDAQGNASKGLGVEASSTESDLYQCLLNPREHLLQRLVKPTDTKGLHLIPSTPELSGFDVNAVAEIGRENRLKRAIASLTQSFDIIIIDTPPSLGLLTVNAFSAAHEVLVPMLPHPFAFDGLENLLGSLEQVREQLNSDLELGGIVLTMHDSRKKLYTEIVREMQSVPSVSAAMMGTIVRQNIALTEAADLGMHIFDYAPLSNGATDFRALAVEYSTKIQEKQASRMPGFDSLKQRILQLNKARISLSPPQMTSDRQ